jgi:hypothetical protein
MHIINLTSENVKRLHAVSITPDGNLVVIGGRNGQGKSSVLDSIEYALGGGEGAAVPVRRGEERARVVVDLGDLIVRRTFTAAGGSTLVVTDKDGKKQGTPQTLLDRLAGKLTFDPFAFTRMKPDEQCTTLKTITGLDFDKEDAERKAFYEQRTEANRKVKSLDAQVNALPIPSGDTPDKELSMADVIAEQQKAIQQNRRNDELRSALAGMSDARLRAARAVLECKAAVAKTESEIRRLQAELVKERDAVASAESAEKREAAREATASAEVAKLVDCDLAKFTRQLTDLERTNAAIKSKRLRNELAQQLRTASAEANALGEKIERIDEDKRRAIAAASYPIPGLSLDPALGVTLAGVPFAQASSAEQLRASVAMGLALNPKLKILLIRDGSLLDQESLAMVAEMAAKAGAQVWIERVGVDAATSVVIEDGSATVVAGGGVKYAEAPETFGAPGAATQSAPRQIVSDTMRAVAAERVHFIDPHTSVIRKDGDLSKPVEDLGY